jgi:hypothetical protein
MITSTGTVKESLTDHKLDVIPLKNLTIEQLTYLTFLEEQRSSSSALGVLKKINQHRDVTRTGREIPGSYTDIDINLSQGYVEDCGAVWRKETDSLANRIASRLPDRELGDLFFTQGVFFTSDGRLYSDNEGVITLMNSLASQRELDSGIRMANETQWENLLVAINLLDVVTD